MGARMKTTIDIADPLFDEAKALADREQTTLRALVEEGLRAVLAGKTAAKPFKLRDARFKGPGQGLTPEAAALGWERIRELAYDYSQYRSGDDDRK
jgi:tRNA(Ile2) C34 agmatinyltransferase TiaS